MTAITAWPLFWMFLASYSGDLQTIDAFYIWSYVNTWYYVSLFWILQIFWFVTVSKRNESNAITPDSTKDHSLNISIVQMLLGIFAIIFQTVWADRLNFWYVKQQFLNGRSVNEAKNNVWEYPASLGSTGRSQYHYENPNRDAQSRVEQARQERNEQQAERDYNNSQRSNDDFSLW